MVLTVDQKVYAALLVGSATAAGTFDYLKKNGLAGDGLTQKAVSRSLNRLYREGNVGKKRQIFGRSPAYYLIRIAPATPPPQGLRFYWQEKD